MRTLIPLLIFLPILILGCGKEEELEGSRLAQDHEVWIDLRLKGFVDKDLEKKISDTPKSSVVLISAEKKSEKEIIPSNIYTEWRSLTRMLIISYGKKESDADRDLANLIAESCLPELNNLADNVEYNPVILRQAKTLK